MTPTARSLGDHLREWRQRRRMRAGLGKGARHLESQTTAAAGHERHPTCQ